MSGDDVEENKAWGWEGPLPYHFSRGPSEGVSSKDMGMGEILFLAGNCQCKGLGGKHAWYV